MRFTRRALAAGLAGLGAVFVGRAAAAAPVGRTWPADLEAAKQRLELLRETAKLLLEMYEASSWQFPNWPNLLTAHRDWLDAAVRLHGDSRELLIEAAAIDKVAAKLETYFERRFDAGVIHKVDYLQVQAHRQWIKLELAELKARVR